MPVTVTAWLALADQNAYGAGRTAWRGASVLKAVAVPFEPTPISSQRGPPLKTPKPKSSVVVNSPLLTATALFVSNPRRLPPPAASKTATRRS